ncbi:MAG: tetratricopeptide repeat protein [Candidatus Hydrogenedentes bacterium]|nr:tetratricopeptide repeat protein [Candidatus Hydrogenedentota bacterium]
MLALALQRQNKRDAALRLIEEMDPRVRASSPEIMTTLCEIYIDQNRLDVAANAAADYARAYPEHVLIHQYLQARMMLARGEIPAAIQRLVAVARGNPQFASARYHLALAYLRQGDYERAHTVLESFLRDFPNDENGLTLREFLYAGEVPRDQALTRSNSLLAARDAQPEQLVFAARALLKHSAAASAGAGKPLDAGESAAATHLLWRAAELEPDLAAPYQLLIRRYLDQADPASAQRALDRAVAGGVDPAAMQKERLLLALANHDAEGAAGLMKQVAGQPNLSAQTVVEYAVVAAKAGQVDLALNLVEQAAGLQPGLGPLLRTEAAILCVRSNLDEKALQLVEAHAGDLDAPADPELREARLRLARLLAVPGSNAKLEAASRLVASVRNDAPAQPDALLLDARIRALQTPPDYESARQRAGQALAANSSNAEAVLLLAQIDFAQGRISEALEGARAAAGLAPQNPEILLFKADLEQAANRPADARDTLRTLVASDPANVQAAIKLFKNYCDGGDLPEAEALLQRIEKTHPDNPAVNLDVLRAKLTVARGQGSAEAVRLLREQYQANPDSAVLRELAAALSAAGERQEAEKLLNDAANGPLKDTPEPWALLGEFYLQADDAESINKASSALTRALLLAPERPGAMRAAIRLFLREGNSDGALNMCQRYLKAQPNDADVLSQEAALLLRAGRPDDALDAIDRALQIVHLPSGVFVRANALLALGRCQEALADLQRIAGAGKIDPADHDAAMAEVYLGLNDEGLARRYYDSAKEKLAANHRPFTDQLNRIKDKLERSSP